MVQQLKRNFLRWLGVLWLSVGVGSLMVPAQVLTLATHLTASHHSNENGNNHAKNSDKGDARKKAHWEMRLKTERDLTITVKANGLRLEEFAQVLTQQTGIPVSVSVLLKAREVELAGEDLRLEELLRTLAPQGFVDSFVSANPLTPPKYLAAYLQGYNEPPPSFRAPDEGSASYTVSGHTEEPEPQAADQGAERTRQPKLTVRWRDGILHVVAQAQPLSVVLYRIAEALGVPCEILGDGDALVDAEINAPPCDVLRTLSPNVAFYQRLNLATSEKFPLHIRLQPVALPQ